MDESRKLIIGKDTWQSGCWVTNREGHIAAHVISRHLLPTGFSRGWGWISLYLDPNTGLHWESQRLQGNLQGGGPYSLIPLTSEDVKRLYGPPDPPASGDPVVLEGRLLRYHSGDSYPDAISKAAKHLRDSHFLDAKSEDGTEIWINPLDSTEWRIEPTEGYEDHPDEALTMRKVDNTGVEGKQMGTKQARSIIGQIEERHGIERENRAACVARHMLDKHLFTLKSSTKEKQKDLCYDPLHQQYWELAYLDEKLRKNGPPSLLPISHVEATDRCGIEPLECRKKVEITDTLYRDIDDDRMRRNEIVEHLMDEHLKKIGGEPGVFIYMDPLEGRYYRIGQEMKLVKAEPKVTEYMTGSHYLIELSYQEVVDLYRELPPQPEDPDVEKMRRSITENYNE